MNLFTIEFVQGKTDAVGYGLVQHSLVDTASSRAVISLSVSADKLQSISNYTREPKRLVFECFPTTWIEDYILSGDYEHVRYISHYEVRAYRDGILFFTGIIDTSQLSFDESSGIIQITCYDKLKLLSIFADLSHYYSQTTGYYPNWILAYFASDIQQFIPISVPVLNQFTPPIVNIDMAHQVLLCHVDYDVLLSLSAPAGHIYYYDPSSWAVPLFGYRVDVLGNKITFAYAHRVELVDNYVPATPVYKARYLGKVYRFYNGIAPVINLFEAESDWVDDEADLTSYDDRFMDFFRENGLTLADLQSLAGGGVIGNQAFTTSHSAGHYVECSFHGYLLPNRLHPGESYATYQESQTNSLKALQATLMLYNATIFTNPQGQIILKNKDAYASAIIEVDDGDVISFVTKRVNQEIPETSVLEVLAGDTTQLQTLVKDYLIDFYDARWSADITLDRLAQYNLSLQSCIRIRGQVFVITALDRDYLNDEYRLTAWRMEI